MYAPSVMRRYLRQGLAFLGTPGRTGLCLGLVLVLATPALADPVDARLVEEAPRVLAYLRQQGATTVGVLKFRVVKPGRGASYSAGPMNANMADRLQNALVVANDRAHPVGILDSVSQYAFERMRLAPPGKGVVIQDSLEGRRRLFALEYPLAWSDERARPDVLLTGDVILRRDNRTALIRIKAMHREAPRDLQLVHEFEVRTDPVFLADCGQTFALSRSAIRSNPEALGDDAAASATALDEGQPSTAPDWARGLELRILYLGSVQPVTPDPGQGGEERFQVREPQEGEEIVLELENKGSETLGVVLAVNGKSTLMEEYIKDRRPEELTRWVLDPGARYTIPGFFTQYEGDNVKKFRVLSEAESERLLLENLSLLDQAGEIRVYVFRRKAGEGGEQALVKATDTGDLRHGPRAAGRPRSLAEAQAAVAARLRKAGALPSRVARAGKRGLIWEEETATPGSPLAKVTFVPDPAFHVRIIKYYRPAGR